MRPSELLTIDFKLKLLKFLVWCEPPACGLLPGRPLRPAIQQRCAGIALRSRLARVPILWSVKLDLFPSFDDPPEFVSRDWHTAIIGFSLACLEHRSSSHFPKSKAGDRRESLNQWRGRGKGRAVAKSARPQNLEPSHAVQDCAAATYLCQRLRLSSALYVQFMQQRWALWDHHASRSPP